MTRIIVFAKAPLPGKVKTRLIPALGEEGAARLAHQMLFDTCREALLARCGSVELCFGGDPDWKGGLPGGVELTDQGEGDLGERLARAAQRVIGGGENLLFIGTDCPALDARRLNAACRALERNDAVIHPTLDGGYAALGLTRFDPSLFEGLEWSTPSVARDTMNKIAALGWSLKVSETLRDIDEPVDLKAAGIL
jgi:uncharacterized protein